MNRPSVYRPNIGQKLKALNASSKTRKIPMKSWLLDNPGKSLMLFCFGNAMQWALWWFVVCI